VELPSLKRSSRILSRLYETPLQIAVNVQTAQVERESFQSISTRYCKDAQRSPLPRACCAMWRHGANSHQLGGWGQKFRLKNPCCVLPRPLGLLGSSSISHELTLLTDESVTFRARAKNPSAPKTPGPGDRRLMARELAQMG
jgi:hypothetical protein